MNFLEETLEVLSDCGKAENDVLWVGNSNKWMSWDKFKEIANFNYDSGFGCRAINLNFVIVGKDWWLEREEYDGSENWSFKSLPIKPDNDNFTFDDLICSNKWTGKCSSYTFYNK